MPKFWPTHRYLAAVLTIIAVLSSLAITRAQQPANTPINGVWDSTIGNSLQTPGSINKLYIGPDQRLYVAGNFAYLNNELGNGLVSWDGTNWHSHGLQANDINSIKTFETYQNQLLIGGSFQNLAGRGINGLGRWDGTQFQGFGGGTQGSNDYWGNTPSQVNDFAVISDTLYIAGNFSQFNNIAASSVAYWKPTGIGALGSFDNKALVAASTGQQLFVGGAFQYINNVEIPIFARFANGQWSSMPMPANVAIWIDNIANIDDSIYAWGYNTSNHQQHSIHRYNNNQWTQIGNTLDLPSEISGLIDANGLYAYNATTVWKLVNNQWQQVTIPASITSITAVAGNSDQLYLAGTFMVNNQPSQLISWDGTSVTSLATTSLPPVINDVGGVNGKLVVNRSGNTNLQQWNGSSWQQLYSMSQGSKMITIDTQRTHLISSNQFSVNNSAPSALWEFNSTGALTNPVAITGTGINWARSNTSLLANGSSGTINGQAYSTTVQINNDHLWQQFNVRHYDNEVKIYFVNNQYYAVKLLSEPYSTIILVDVWRNNRWQELDGIQVGNDTDVHFVVWRDRLYISGQSALYQLNDDGMIQQIAQFNNLVKCLATVGDDYLYVGGKFNAVNQQTTGSVARWDGMVWQGLATPVNGTVEQMAVTSSDLYLAGNFTHAGSIPSLGVAHLQLEYQPPSNTVTPSNTPTNTATPSNMATPTNTSTATNTAVPTDTPTNTATPTNTSTATNTAVPSNTATNTATNTAVPTNTPTNIPTSTAVPTTIPSQTYTVFIAYVVK
ncbi:hypothetical protein [Herpetosiphon llansteffanensis]|uniref:hypothetical protein n=1 Tax=Herpetosiphon llansteffanensis TaxID=2094568 RepID=UPI00196AF017|nr:hypothetical protein [Herpetosiphon llansteffanensis]